MIKSFKRHQQINKYNKQMQLKRIINKNYPPDIVSDSAKGVLILKSHFENWVQIHSQDSLIDAISLPWELKMSKLSLAIDQKQCKYNKDQYFFTNNHTVYVGLPDSDAINMQISHYSIPESIFMSNPIKIQASKYLNISLNSSNQSKLNLFSLEQNLNIQYRQVPLSYNISHASNLLHESERLFYISNNPVSETMICYDLSNQSVNSCFQLPDIEMQTGMNCFLVPQSNQRYKQILCVYGRDWLAFSDLRMKGLIGIQKLYNCESAFTFPEEDSFKVYYTQGSMIYQFDMRKNSSKRVPFLIHQNCILNANSVNKNLIKIQDNCTPGAYLYKFSHG